MKIDEFSSLVAALSQKLHESDTLTQKRRSKLENIITTLRESVLQVPELSGHSKVQMQHVFAQFTKARTSDEKDVFQDLIQRVNAALVAIRQNQEDLQSFREYIEANRSHPDIRQYEEFIRIGKSMQANPDGLRPELIGLMAVATIISDQDTVPSEASVNGATLAYSSSYDTLKSTAQRIYNALTEMNRVHSIVVNISVSDDEQAGLKAVFDKALVSSKFAEFAE